MRYWILTCALLFTPSLVFGQTIPTHYDANITGAANSTYRFAASEVTCNVQVLPGVDTLLNPRYLIWDDINNVGNYCVHDTGNASGPLFALPIGDYNMSLTALVITSNGSAPSPPSNTVNFSRLVQPVARTGFRVRGAS